MREINFPTTTLCKNTPALVAAIKQLKERILFTTSALFVFGKPTLINLPILHIKVAQIARFSVCENAFGG
jgi:hypothetical protein